MATVALLTLSMAACNFGDEETIENIKSDLYSVSGFDVTTEAPGYDSLYIPEFDLQIVAERNIFPLLSADEYSTVIYYGHKGNVKHDNGLFVGSSTRRPCFFQVVNDSTIDTEVFNQFKVEAITKFFVDKLGDITITSKRNARFKQTLVFSNWTHDLGMLSTDDWTAKSDITVTGNTEHSIRIDNGVTITFNNVSIYNSVTCNGSATVILASGSHNLIKAGHNYMNGFMNGDDGTTLTIEGTGELIADMSLDRDRAAIGGGRGDIIIKSGTITALGGHGGAGIGANRTGTTGNITIMGGNITAIGGADAAGIGSGDQWSYEDIGSVPSHCGDILITGGTVTATGKYDGAGIGSGYRSICRSITIRKSVTSVTATKGEDAPNSIGAGYDGSCGEIIIEDEAAVVQN